MSPAFLFASSCSIIGHGLLRLVPAGCHGNVIGVSLLELPVPVFHGTERRLPTLQHGARLRLPCSEVVASPYQVNCCYAED